MESFERVRRRGRAMARRRGTNGRPALRAQPVFKGAIVPPPGGFPAGGRGGRDGRVDPPRSRTAATPDLPQSAAA